MFCCQQNAGHKYKPNDRKNKKYNLEYFKLDGLEIGVRGLVEERTINWVA